MNTTTLEKGRKPSGHFLPSLSMEAWSALKMANIGGTSDSDLAGIYEVSEDAIRKKRSRDKGWAIAVGLKNKYLGNRGLKSKHLESIKPVTDSHRNADMSGIEAENRASVALHATFADESQVTRALALQIAQKGLKSALDKEGALLPLLHPTEPAHVKVYADIAAKAGSWQPETSITVNCQAFAGASLARNDENENTIMDI